MASIDGAPDEDGVTALIEVQHNIGAALISLALLDPACTADVSARAGCVPTAADGERRADEANGEQRAAVATTAPDAGGAAAEQTVRADGASGQRTTVSTASTAIDGAPLATGTPAYAILTASTITARPHALPTPPVPCLQSLQPRWPGRHQPVPCHALMMPRIAIVAVIVMMPCFRSPLRPTRWRGCCACRG